MNWYITVLKNYANFSGRARRSEYWWFTLINTIVSFTLGCAEGIVGVPGIVSGLYSLAVLIPGWAVIWRRLHDTGRSGWWIFINLIPCIGWIAFFVFLVQDSEPGSNQYGPNPKDPYDDDPAAYFE